MPINSDEIISVISQLADHENLQVTIKESAKGACIVGSSAFAGGILGGPVGLCIGGIAGSFAGLMYGRGRYRSVVDVITYDMTPTQQRLLAESVNMIISELRIEDCTVLLPFILQNSSIKEKVLLAIVNYIQNEMRMSIAA